MNREDYRNVYELIKPIDSPTFTEELKIGRRYVLPQLKHLFGDNILRNGRFLEFFKVSETHEFKNCAIVPKEKDVVSKIEEQKISLLVKGILPTNVVMRVEDVERLSEQMNHLFATNRKIEIKQTHPASKGRICKLMGLNIIEAVSGIEKGEVCVF